MSKAKRPKRPDQHTSGLLVRFPEWCRPVFEELKKRNRRPTTVEALIALERHCAAEGIAPPKPPAA